MSLCLVLLVFGAGSGEWHEDPRVFMSLRYHARLLGPHFYRRKQVDFVFHHSADALASLSRPHKLDLL